MTPLQIESAVRRRYNAENDSFWSTDEIMDLIYAASLELANETNCIENVVTATTVADQRAYTMPSEAVSIFRVEYDGDSLERITWREDDAITLSNADTTTSGTPRYYAEFENVVYLRPIPDSALTLKVYSYNEPQSVTTSSTLDIPSRYHMDLCYFVLAEMYEKSKDVSGSNRYRQLWLNAISKAKRLEKRRKRGGAFGYVLDMDTLPSSLLGVN